jgi:hypothetical protein
MSCHLALSSHVISELIQVGSVAPADLRSLKGYSLV